MAVSIRSGVAPTTAAFFDDALAVIVVYRRALDETATFHTLDAALRATGSRVAVLVYDNSPRAASLPIAAERWEVHAVGNPSNPGVSAAYVAGAKLAARLGKSWLLFFDQDTSVPIDGLDAYARAVAAYPDEVLFAPVLRSGIEIVSPCAYRFLRGTALPAVPAGRRALRGVSVLNSGMCVRRDAYDAAGGHDARIPLDFSDHEFVARFSVAHPAFVVIDATFQHGFSGHEAQTVAQRVTRFEAYCRGAIRTPRHTSGRLAAGVFVLARAAVLAWRWRSAAFLAAPFRNSRARA